MITVQSRADITSETVAIDVTSIIVEGFSYQNDKGRSVYRRYVPEAATDAIVAAFPSAIDIKKQWAINRVVSRLSGFWEKLSVLADFGGAGENDVNAALVNWKGGGLLAKGGSLVYTPGLGFTGDGSTGYVSAGPLNALGSQDSYHVGAWLTTDQTGCGELSNDFVLGATGSIYLRPNNAGRVTAVVNNSVAINLGRVSGQFGHTVVNRSGPAGVQAYRNGKIVGKSTQAATGFGTNDLLFFSYAGTFCHETIGWAHVGASLTSFEVATLYDAMTEYRHIIEHGADPAKLIQSADGAWWELDHSQGCNIFQFGAKGNNLADDTQAWIDATALRIKLSVPQPLVAYRVKDEIPVRAHISGDWATVNLVIDTLYSRGFWLQHKSRLEGLEITRTLNNMANVSGDRHCAVLVGQFHDDQRPFHDIVVDVRLFDDGPKRHNMLSVLGDIKDCEFSVVIEGDGMSNGFMTHWGSVISSSSEQQVVQRPRDCYVKKLRVENTETPGNFGLYLSGLVGWTFLDVTILNINSGVVFAAGDLGAGFDSASNNQTIGQLLSDIDIINLYVENFVYRGVWFQGASDDEGGTRWFASDPKSNSSSRIGSLTAMRGANTILGHAVQAQHWKGVLIENINAGTLDDAGTSVQNLIDPMVKIEACRDMVVKGSIRARAAIEIVSGDGIHIDVDARNLKTDETSSDANGIKVGGANLGITITNSVPSGGQTVTIASVPAHICPKMAFEVGGQRYVFDGSAMENTSNVSIAILPAPASIAANTSATLLNGCSNVKIEGSVQGYHTGNIIGGTSSKSPRNVEVWNNVEDSALYGTLMSNGENLFVLGGLYDRNNRLGSTSSRDVRCNGTGKGYAVKDARFLSKATYYHVAMPTSASGCVVSGNHCFGAITQAIYVPAVGADGVANLNFGNWIGS